jgi:hypothetical protein
MIYLASGWRKLCRMHEIMVGHFLVFNYDGKRILTASVFDETMCRRHYTTAAVANTKDSSSDDE